MIKSERIETENLVCNGFRDYELLDCGNFQKLERFGSYILRRPEPQALWEPVWEGKKWKTMTHVEFIPSGSHSGKWKKYINMPDEWNISYSLNTGDDSESKGKEFLLRFHLALTSFKHVGIFPEQSLNWDYIYRFFANSGRENSGLNLFAYTGAATLAGSAAGLNMVHVDSVKQVVSWANRNRELCGLPQNIRWIVDDAMSFVKKEIKRKRKYELIVLDPPAYGHGPRGEKWKLEDHLNEMMKQVTELLNPDYHLMILNVYSLGLSPLILYSLLQNIVRKSGSRLKVGEICIKSRSGLLLPLGIRACLEKK